MFEPSYFFALGYAPIPGLYEGIRYVWEALPRIEELVESRVKPGIDSTARVSPTAFVGEKVQIGPGTVVEHGAVIEGPAIIGARCVIRANALIRDHVILGDKAVVGFCCECKKSVLHSEANAFHLAYIGDSLLGYKAHLGAGVKISNLKLNWSNVTVKGPEGLIDTGLVKFGAVLGDCSDVGCNSVLNPGALIGPGSSIYANSSWRGFLPAGRIAKLRQGFEVVELKK